MYIEEDNKQLQLRLTQLETENRCANEKIELLFSLAAKSSGNADKPSFDLGNSNLHQEMEPNKPYSLLTAVQEKFMENPSPPTINAASPSTIDSTFLTNLEQQLPAPEFQLSKDQQTAFDKLFEFDDSLYSPLAPSSLSDSSAAPYFSSLKSGSPSLAYSFPTFNQPETTTILPAHQFEIKSDPAVADSITTQQQLTSLMCRNCLMTTPTDYLILVSFGRRPLISLIQSTRPDCLETKNLSVIPLLPQPMNMQMKPSMAAKKMNYYNSLNGQLMNRINPVTSCGDFQKRFPIASEILSRV